MTLLRWPADVVAQLVTDQSSWTALLEANAGNNAYIGFWLIVLLAALTYVAFNLGRWLGFRAFKQAMRATLAAYAEETVQRDKTYAGLLKVRDSASADRLAALREELAEVAESRRTYEILSAKAHEVLTRKRWFCFAPRSDDLLLDEVIEDRDRFVVYSRRLAFSIRKTLERVDALPQELRDDLYETLRDAPAPAETAESPDRPGTEISARGPLA